MACAELARAAPARGARARARRERRGGPDSRAGGKAARRRSRRGRGAVARRTGACARARGRRVRSTRRVRRPSERAIGGGRRPHRRRRRSAVRRAVRRGGSGRELQSAPRAPGHLGGRAGDAAVCPNQGEDARDHGALQFRRTARCQARGVRAAARRGRSRRTWSRCGGAAAGARRRGVGSRAGGAHRKVVLLPSGRSQGRDAP